MWKERSIDTKQASTPELSNFVLAYLHVWRGNVEGSGRRRSCIFYNKLSRHSVVSIWRITSGRKWEISRPQGIATRTGWQCYSGKSTSLEAAMAKSTSTICFHSVPSPTHGEWFKRHVISTKWLHHLPGTWWFFWVSKTSSFCLWAGWTFSVRTDTWRMRSCGSRSNGRNWGSRIIPKDWLGPRLWKLTAGCLPLEGSTSCVASTTRPCIN